MKRKNINYFKNFNLKKISENIQNFFVVYFLTGVVTYLLEKIFGTNNNLMFILIKIIVKILSLPFSMSDFVIFAFKLHWYIFILGFVFTVCKIYNRFKKVKFEF